MATVLLVRHARTTANSDGTLAGRTDVGLDDAGTAQALALRDRLAGLRFAAIVSSPLARCRQTVELALPGAVAALEPGLIECGYGDWEGQSLQRLARDPLWRLVQQHPSGVVFPGPGAESMAEMSSRAVAAVRAWDERVSRTHGPVALWLACTHGDLIKAVVADALGLHLDQFQRVVVEPGSITVIQYTPARPFLLRLNDTGAALAALAATPPHPARPEFGDSDAVPGGDPGPALRWVDHR